MTKATQTVTASNGRTFTCEVEFAGNSAWWRVFENGNKLGQFLASRGEIVSAGLIGYKTGITNGFITSLLSDTITNLIH
jgi:hypothetical protein